MLVCKAYIWAFVRKNASIRGKKTHVYRVAGMIASIRGKKPHVYRVIILKQMADHSHNVSGIGLLNKKACLFCLLHQFETQTLF